MLTGWLSPEGKMHDCPYFGHSSAAEYIMKDRGYSYDGRTPLDELLVEKYGWIKIYHSTMFWSGICFYYDRSLITNEQRRFLKEQYEADTKNYLKEGRLALYDMDVLERPVDEDGFYIE